MSKRRWWFVAASVMLAWPHLSSGANPAPGLDVQGLAAKIDQQIAAKWAADKIEPAPVADDAEFLRRVYLDVAGRIPSVAEARQFLDDKSPDKRARVVERLLDGPRYVSHSTNVWRALLLPEATTTFQARAYVPGFEAWLRKQLVNNTPYDQMVRELLTTPIGQDSMQKVYANAGAEPTALGFYLAKEVKPENVAASAARLFLGVRLECAQCHNHPFAKWKRDQFWSLAAFFAGLRRQGQGDFVAAGNEIAGKHEIAIPGTDKLVQAAFIDGSKPQWKEKATPRAKLAEWITSAENPYFARATANRLWAYFFGTGLVDPVDEMVGGESTASHPELLDELAHAFVAHHFDLKFLIRAITASKAYQLTSAKTHASQDDPHAFARMPLRGLTGEQLFDSVAQATGFIDLSPNNNARFVLNGGGARDEFLSKFANQSDKPTETQTSILQALSLMNGKLIGDATNIERSETLAAVVDAPFMDTNERIETLYLATLTRKPTVKELARLTKFVDEAAAKEGGSKNYAIADVFWTLLNSGEFMLNH
jgi:hypothetical protein